MAPSEHDESPWGQPHPRQPRGSTIAHFCQGYRCFGYHFWRHAHVPISSGDRWPGAEGEAWGPPHPAGGPQLSPTRLLKKWVTADITIQAICPRDTCKWLTLSSTELCGKKCLTDFCKVHLVRLRKGSLSLG